MTEVIDLSEMITVPFSRLILHYREIGVHRGRRWGFRDVFGFRTLRDVPFIELAQKVKDAYENHGFPPHEGWPAQREALRWLVDKGRPGILAIDPQGIEVKRESARYWFDDQGNEQIERRSLADHYYVSDGHHRALALFILGDKQIRARVSSDQWLSRRRDRHEAPP